MRYAITYSVGDRGWAHGTYPTRGEAEAVLPYLQEKYPEMADTLQVEEYDPREAAYLYYPLGGFALDMTP